MLIDEFVSDFGEAYGRSVELDNKIVEAAAQISDNYVDLVSLATRQTFGSLEITTNGGANSSDVKVFMKDLGTSLSVWRSVLQCS